MHKIKIYLSFASYFVLQAAVTSLPKARFSALIRWHRKGTGFFISYNNLST